MDIGLQVLLDLDGTEYTEENGYWYKIAAWTVDKSPERPHGIRYKGRIVEYDHAHYHKDDPGTPYSFESAEQLLEDFFTEVTKRIQSDVFD